MTIHEFTANNFDREVLRANEPVLVFFAARWSAPCKALTAIVEKLAVELDGKATVGKLDIDASKAVAMKYKVRSVPTVMAFRGGQKTGEYVGLTTRDKLVKLLGV